MLKFKGEAPDVLIVQLPLGTQSDKGPHPLNGQEVPWL